MKMYKFFGRPVLRSPENARTHDHADELQSVSMLTSEEHELPLTRTLRFLVEVGEDISSEKLASGSEQSRDEVLRQLRLLCQDGLALRRPQGKFLASQSGRSLIRTPV